MKVKYLSTRERANGRIIYAVSPPLYVQQALGVTYEQYEVKKDAINRAMQIADAYKEYKKGNKKDISIKQDTVEGLIAFYKGTNEWSKLKDNTKSLYLLMIRTALDSRIGESKLLFKDYLARTITPTHADKLYDIITKQVSRHRAVHTVKVLRKIWFVGKRHSKVQSNPFEKMGLKGLKSRTTLWSPEQVKTFIATADDMNKGSVGTLALLCYDLCQRPGDMRQLTWANYDGNAFEFVQEKTGQRVNIPGSPRLVERLSNLPTNRNEEDPIVICEATKKGFDRRLYSKWAATIRQEAKLPRELKLSDLRRTGATEMAESGCTEDELRSVTGHQSRDVLSIYVRPTDKLAATGINKRFG
jgi:integrase